MHSGAGAYRWRRVVWGAAVFVLGLWWLLGELGKVEFRWEWAGPLAIMAGGLSMLVRGSWCGCGDCHESHQDEEPHHPS